jgi:uncharacterized protein YjdB
MKKNRIILLKTTLLLLFGLCMADGVHADIRIVTSSADDGSEGTFRYIMNHLTDDDETITFADNLATETIQLGTGWVIAFGSAVNFNGKNLTVRGNGVTISGSTTFFGTATGNQTMNNLHVENIHFTDISGEYINFNAESGRVRNCSFRPSANSTKHPLISPAGGTIIFEGCAFIAKDGRQPYVSNGTLSVSKVSFVSCTFVKPAGSYDIMVELFPGSSYTYPVDTEKSLISFSNAGSVEMTNCVVMDYSTNSSGKPTFDVSNNKLVSKGYNVILQGEKEPLGWVSVAAAGDTVMPVGATPAPLTLDEGIYKVPLSSPALHRLPSDLQRATNYELAGIEFPPKDLAGNTVEYTCNTHSGAWQTLYLADGEQEPGSVCDGEEPTGVTITPPSGTIYTESGTYEFTAVVAPGGASQAVTWTSSDENIATINNDGNKGILTPLTAGQVTITATSDVYPTVYNTVTVDIADYIHVTGITLEVDTIRSTHHLQHLLRPPVITPADAFNKAFEWEFIDPNNVVARTLRSDIYTLAGKEAGEAKVVVRAADEGNGIITDTCVLIFNDPHYTEGIFMLTEGNYPATGKLNFLHPDGKWEYNIYTELNSSINFDSYINSFGVTSQYGAIYGGKFYVTSKQGPRLVVFDPVTIEHYSKHEYFPSGDGRAFLGVDEHTGYVGSSSGIHVINLDDISSASGNMLPAVTIEGSQSGGGLYTGQIGTMIRVGERVFAVHQNNGIRVINARTHTVETTLNAHHYAVLTQSLDGYLWASATVSESTGELSDPGENEGQGGMVDAEKIYNALIRIDPWTLEVKEIPLPDGVGAPPSTWAAWQADPFCGSPKENVLYWIDRKRGPQLIRRYDIATDEVTTVFDISDYPVPSEHQMTPENDKWNMYGPSFRIHPVTGDLYVWITLFNLLAPNPQRAVWEVHRINPSTGEKLGIYPLKETYWWPSLFIFPDNADPTVVDETPFQTARTLNATHRYDTLALRPLVTDADQMASAIVKTIEAVGDTTLIDVFIRHDSLFIIPLKDLPTGEQKQTTLSLKFNSNGKVLTRDLTVNVEPGAIAHPVKGVALNRATAEVAVGETLQLTVGITPTNADNKALTWTSSQPLIASVDQNGLVTAHLAPATVDITATTAEGGFKSTCTVTTKATSVIEYTIHLNHTIFDMTEGDRAEITAAVTPRTNQAITWSTSNRGVADVAADGFVFDPIYGNAAKGTISAIGGGDAVITVQLAGGASAWCRVTVRERPVAYTIRLNHATLVMNEGDRTAITAAVSPSTGEAVTWSSSHPEVADVTASGTVIAIAGGNTTITAQLGGASATCNVTVRDVPVSVEVDEVSASGATLTFPRLSGVSYYLVHLYEVSDRERIPLVSYKVNSGGEVVDTINPLRSSSSNDIRLVLSDLRSSTLHEADIDVVREIDGIAETVSKLIISFTTQWATGLERIDALNAAVWYSNGALHLRNLEGYNCRITSVSGPVLSNRKAASHEETHSISLPPGVYILTAQKESERLIFKFVVF